MKRQFRGRFPVSRIRRGLTVAGRHRSWLTAALVVLILAVSVGWCLAADVRIPGLNLNLDGVNGPNQISGVMKIVIVLTILSLAPSLLILTTSFTRIIVVFSMMRHALGTQQSPPTQLLVGLALFLTYFVMQPVWQQVYHNAIVPYREQTITGDQFVDRAIEPVKTFMLKQTRKKDLSLFINLANNGKPKSVKTVSMSVVIPAFVISELTTAFEIGFLLFIPFIVLDMVVASVLLSMGMMMLPPVMISLPFKLMLFILVDGWDLLVGSLIKSFH